MESRAESDVSIEDWLRIDSLCDDFEKRLGTSREPSIAECLNQLSEDSYLKSTFLYELVRVALEHDRLDLPRDYLTREDRHYFEVVARACRHFGNPESSTIIYPTGSQVAVADFPKTERFQCLRQIGSGGMGNVYEAYDRERNMHVALKTLHSLSGETLHQFKHEFRTLAELDHPNLIRFYEFFQSDQHWFFTMELAEGVDVLSYCREKHGGNFDVIRRCLIQIVHGLNHLHQHGKIHRDVKPSNLLVTPGGDLKILDFGLILDLSQAPLSGRLVGTPAYMSPEQMTSQTLEPASDWFSVGVILYEILTGERSISESTVTEHPSSHPSDLQKLYQGLTIANPKERITREEIFKILALESQPEAITSPDIFAGRQDLLQKLARFAPGADRKESSLVILSGRSGEGKSALARHYLAELGKQPEMVILSSRCYDHESVQYPGIDGLTDELSNHLTSLPQEALGKMMPRDLSLLIRVFPGLGKVAWPHEEEIVRNEDVVSDPRLLRQRAALSLQELLIKLARHSHLILFIDDFQWAGDDSRTLLNFLVQDMPSCLTLLTCRSEHSHLETLLESVSPILQRREAHFEHLELTPFSIAEASELAEKICQEKGIRTLTKDELQQVYTESGGHAYLLSELLQNRDSQMSPLSERDTLEDVLQRKIQSLSREKQSLLEMVSLSAAPLETRWAYDLADINESDPIPIRQLKDEKLISYSQVGMDAFLHPYHDAIRATVTQSLSSTTKTQYHKKLANHFRSRNQTVAPQVIAFHLEQAGRPKRSAVYFRDAASQALGSFAFEQAVGYFRKALEMDHAFKESEVIQIRESLAEALENAGKYCEAADELRKIGKSQKEKTKKDHIRQAALLYCSSGHLNQGLDLLKELLRKEGYVVHHGRKIRNGLSWIILQLTLALKLKTPRTKNQIDPVLAAKADLFLSAACGLSLVDPFVATHLMVKGTHLAHKSGDQNLLGKALAFNASYQSSGSHRLSSYVEKMDPFVKELCETSGNPHIKGIYFLTRGITIGHRAETIESTSILQQAESILSKQCRGVWWELAVVRTSIIWNLSLLGKLKELDQFIQGFLEETEKRNDLFMSANIHTYPIPLILLSKDDPEKAAEIADHAIAEWSRNPGFHIQHYTHMVGRAMVYLYAGDAQQASLFFEGKWKEFTRSGMFLFPYMKMWSLDARITVALGAVACAPKEEEQRFLKMIRTYLKSLRSVPLESAPILALRFEGVLAHLQGQALVAEESLSEAASGLRKHGLVAYALSTEHFLAEIQGSSCSEETQKEFENCGIRKPILWRRAQLGI